jgi:small-conductance mechanosensitive channel
MNLEKEKVKVNKEKVNKELLIIKRDTKGSIVTFIVTTILMLIIILSVYLSNKTKSTNIISNIEIHNSLEETLFENSLILLKLGIIIFLILISIIYYIKYKDEFKAATYLDVYDYRVGVFKDIALTGLAGMLSIVYIFLSRGQEIFSISSISTMLLVGSVLSLFTLSLESSGFNRYLARSEILECKGAYYYIDTGMSDHKDNINKGAIEEQVLLNKGCLEKNKTKVNKIIKFEEEENPFVKSTGSSKVLLIIAIIIIILIILMIYTTWSGFTSDKYDISQVKFFNITCLSKYNTLVFFILELILVGGINAIPPFLSPYFRKEGYTHENKNKNLIIGLVMFIIGIITQFMFQYNGLLNF